MEIDTVKELDPAVAWGREESVLKTQRAQTKE
jgi:hypothetical protein